MQKLPTLFIACSLLTLTTACSQESSGGQEETDTLSPRALILAEGILLYQLEITSWKSSEIIREQQPELMTRVGGYFSYPMEESGFKTVFLSDGKPEKIIGEVEYTDLYHDEPDRTFYQERSPTELEEAYLALRNDALERSADENFFQYYDNTASNMVPIIHQGEKRVYLLTSSKLRDYFFFGNDYLLTYNAAGEFQKQEKLHENFMVLEAKAEAVNGVVGTTHSHGEGSSAYITPTDICNLLLYGEYTNWDQHYVVSETQVSIWDLRKQDLVIRSKEAFQNNKLQDTTRQGQKD